MNVTTRGGRPWTMTTFSSRNGGKRNSTGEGGRRDSRIEGGRKYSIIGKGSMSPIVACI